jgi:low affinity Fe/Cu permease
MIIGKSTIDRIGEFPSETLVRSQAREIPNRTNTTDTGVEKERNSSMKQLYIRTERGFEQLTSIAIGILGNSITFGIALITVVFWLTHRLFYAQDINERIGDIIQGVTFLSLFIIQKSFKRFSSSLHVKVNELVVSHEPASNTVISMGEKTDRDLTALLNAYAELHGNTRTPKEDILPIG